jgi:hypothetical protein
MNLSIDWNGTSAAKSNGEIGPFSLPVRYRYGGPGRSSERFF